jgi:hypothetical protein
MPGAQCTRSPACAGELSMHTGIHSEAPESSGIPHAMVLRLTPRSPRGPGFLAPVTCATRLRRRKLSASVGAPGPHGFALRKQAALVCRAARVHRITPDVHDDRDTPLLVRRDEESKPGF